MNNKYLTRAAISLSAALAISACAVIAGNSNLASPPPTEPQRVAPIFHFNWVISSDPQFPRINMGGDGPAFDESLSRQLILAQYNNINAFRNANGGTANVPVFINGDLTEFYHGNQAREIKGLMAMLGPAVYYGLGNHDYDNNVDDCQYNGCARDAVRDAYAHGQAISAEALDMTVTYDSWTNYQLWRGSLAYAKTLSDFMFIQLHNHPAYQRNFKANEDPNTSFTFDIKQSLDWLEKRLRAAKDAGKIPIINMHRPPVDPTDGYSSVDVERFKKLVEDYGVKAIFYGHTHLIEKGSFGSVPTFNSGAAHNKNFLVAQYNIRHGEVTVKQATDNVVQTNAYGTFKVKDAQTASDLSTEIYIIPDMADLTVKQPPIPYLLWTSVTLQVAGQPPRTLDFPADKEDGTVKWRIENLSPNTEYTLSYTAHSEKGTSISGSKPFKTTPRLDPVKDWCAHPYAGNGTESGWRASWERGENWGALRMMYELNVYGENGAVVKQLALTPYMDGFIAASVWHDYHGKSHQIGVRAFNMSSPSDSAPPRKYPLDLLPIMVCH
ncbi:metallophosphoesterase [Pseudomonas sichuanensis]|uniref:metallophosphoesterase family protein n=1 Tax=Pseudomonas sichuanensis TaxID=2213015 RepID=UPI00244BD37E|nr:metallophosphoesterase [Pseudomonas sichuanensis]MDH0733517.1 metallophosphoesterase [Pseudomonas sichuanensis]MDH1585903.1 metallophosphoesterase [Pseudomonas sichuanensis]MDH1594869.1 metallophosphoesterase [Pseudomonas sichuanensis]MDH1599122.1 metallophosphoesterase [Pseudomonas sichuanensis]